MISFRVQTSPGTTATAVPLLAMSPEVTATAPAAVPPMVALMRGTSLMNYYLVYGADTLAEVPLCVTRT